MRTLARSCTQHPPDASLCADIALMLCAHGQTAAADELLEAAERRFPSDKALWRHKAHARAAAGDVWAAAATMERVLRKDSLQADDWLDLAEWRQALGQQQQALQAVWRARDVCHDVARWDRAAHVLWALGESDDAFSIWLSLFDQGLGTSAQRGDLAARLLQKSIGKMPKTKPPPSCARRLRT